MLHGGRELYATRDAELKPSKIMVPETRVDPALVAVESVVDHYLPDLKA